MAMSVPYTMASTGYQVNHCCLSRSFLKSYFNVLICISQHIFTYFFNFFWHYQFIILFSLIRLVFLCWFCVLSRSVMSDSLWSQGLQPARLICPWNFPGKNTRVGCHFQLPWIFLTQGLNPCLLCPMPWQVDSLPPAPPGKPLCWLWCALYQHCCWLFLSALFYTVILFIYFILLTILSAYCFLYNLSQVFFFSVLNCLLSGL